MLGELERKVEACEQATRTRCAEPPPRLEPMGDPSTWFLLIDPPLSKRDVGSIEAEHGPGPSEVPTSTASNPIR